MSEYSELFERAGARFQTPDLRLEGMLRLRDRRQRTKRITAAAVGIAVALAAIFAGASVIRSSPRLPVTTPPVRNGDITFMVQDGLGGAAPGGARPGGLHLPCCDAFGGWIEAAEWSPDGTRLAYAIYAYEPTAVSVSRGVYVLDVASGHVEGLTEGPADSLDWSPDGGRLAYSDGSAIHVVDADGSNAATVWAGAGQARDPTWSPSGTEIAMSVLIDSGGPGGSAKPSDGTIHVIGVDGTNDRVIATGSEGPAAAPAWSPDGSTIAYIEGCGVWVMSPDGSNKTLIRHLDGCRFRRGLALGQTEPATVVSFSDATKLVWSPDGMRIAINLQTVDNGFPLYVMHPDGTGFEELEVPAGATPPIAWQPVL